MTLPAQISPRTGNFHRGTQQAHFYFAFRDRIGRASESPKQHGRYSGQRFKPLFDNYFTVTAPIISVWKVQ